MKNIVADFLFYFLLALEKHTHRHFILSKQWKTVFSLKFENEYSCEMNDCVYSFVVFNLLYFIVVMTTFYFLGDKQ